VTFSANNLATVAGQIKGERRAWVFADNDESGTGEKVARETGMPFAMSPHVGMDANDHHRKHGLMDLSVLVMKARNQC
jgi:putative DNA primase/helicase